MCVCVCVGGGERGAVYVGHGLVFSTGFMMWRCGTLRYLQACLLAATQSSTLDKALEVIVQHNGVGWVVPAAINTILQRWKLGTPSNKAFQVHIDMPFPSCTCSALDFLCP